MKGIGSKSLSAYLLLVLWAAYATARPVVLETYGDSLTVGFLANTDVTSNPPLSLIDQIYTDLAKWTIFHDPIYIAPYTRPENSWPVMLAQTIEEKTGEHFEVRNQAVSGSRSENLVNQVKMNGLTSEESISFFFMGHNDLCKNESSPAEISKEFLRHYNTAVSEWDKNHTHATAYVIPIGAIHRVFKLLENYTWHHNRANKTALGCYDSWTRLFPYCPRYAHMQKAGKLQSYLKPRIDEMNRSLNSQVQLWNKNSQGGNRVVYLDGLNENLYKVDHFAIDCFHLSARGQKAVSQALFEKIEY